MLRTGRDSENQFRIFVSAGFHSRTLSCSQKSKSDATTTQAGRQLSSHAHARYITVSCFSIVENHQFDKSKTKRLQYIEAIRQAARSSCRSERYSSAHVTPRREHLSERRAAWTALSGCESILSSICLC